MCVLYYVLPRDQPATAVGGDPSSSASYNDMVFDLVEMSFTYLPSFDIYYVSRVNKQFGLTNWILVIYKLYGTLRCSFKVRLVCTRGRH